jgi:hypothetical protein
VSDSEERAQDQVGHPVRDARTGKFQAGVSGNKAGRPKGAPSLASTKNAHLRDQIIEAARLAGMEIDPSSSDGVTAYLYSIAVSDKKAMSSLLGRVLPIMPMRVSLPPIEKAADLVGANSALLKAAANGEISTSDASLGSIVGNVAKAMELNQIVCRLDELERRLSEKGYGK